MSRENALPRARHPYGDDNGQQLAQRLWKHHRVASVALMIAATAGTSFIVSHNASIAMR